MADGSRGVGGMVRECEVVRRACECGAKAECLWVRKAECACAQMDRVQIARRTFRPREPSDARPASRWRVEPRVAGVVTLSRRQH